MLITLLNLTPDSLLCHPQARKQKSTSPKDAEIVVAPSVATVAKLPNYCRKLKISPLNSDSPSFREKPSEWVPEGLIIRVSLALGASWKMVAVTADCPWRIFCSKITRSHHQIMIIPWRDMSKFLSDMPDTVPLSSLLLPGTHDSMAFYGWPVSKCQKLRTLLPVQLASGIRVIDVRLAIIKSRLIAYHGIYPQRTPFQEILTSVHDFLTAPETSGETIVMSIKQEDFAKHSYLDFSNMVHEEIFNGPGGPDMWFFENRIPSLGEVRGKVVLFSRFGGNGEGWEGGWEGLGIHPLTWPDSSKSGFTWECKNTLVRTHDWYNVPSFLAIPEKVKLATNNLLPPVNDPPVPTLAMSYFSAASFPLAFPPTIAKGFGFPKQGFGIEGVNSRLAKWLIDSLAKGYKDEPNAVNVTDATGPRIRGWTLLDFFSEPEGGLVPLLVECNYHGRRSGEEGW